MSVNSLLQRMMARFPWIAAAAYFGLAIAFVAGTGIAISDLLDRRGDANAASEIFERLQGRSPGVRNVADASEAAPSGPPLLEGSTVTVAGAALLQRVANAVVTVEGNVLSSQVDLQGAKSKDGFIGVIINCEVDQPALQRLLYDLEAGMPFLFVDQVVVQAPVSSSTGKEGRMRVLLAVSGQWQGTK